MPETVKDKGGKKPLTEIQVMARIENLLPGLSKAGLEFISAKIQEVYNSVDAPATDDKV